MREWQKGDEELLRLTKTQVRKRPMAGSSGVRTDGKAKEYVLLSSVSLQHRLLIKRGAVLVLKSVFVHTWTYSIGQRPGADHFAPSDNANPVS
jgi:hypothetical protein